jgi:hypothetical protein
MRRPDYRLPLVSLNEPERPLVAFAKAYAIGGRPSIAPERLLRAVLLQAFFQGLAQSGKSWEAWSPNLFPLSLGSLCSSGWCVARLAPQVGPLAGLAQVQEDWPPRA